MDEKNNTELGLIDIFQVIGHWIVSLAKILTNWFLYLFFFGIKRWKILLIVGVAAGIYSFVTFKMQPDQYEANMIVRSNAVQSFQMKSFLETYSNLLDNNLLDGTAVMSKVGLSSDQCNQVTSMSIYSCVDENKDGIVDYVDKTGRYDASSEETDSLNLGVSVNFEDVSILDDLQKSIVYYLENNTYISNRNINRLSKLNKRKALLASEISLLDSLQRSIYEGTNVANSTEARGSYFLVDNRKVLVYEDKLILLDQLEIIEREIEIYCSPITIVQDFNIGKRAVNGLAMILKKNILSALSGAYLLMFMFFLYNREKGKYLS